MTRERYKRFLRNANGAVAATYALALIPLIAIAGLAFDYTRAMGLDTELQNAADQAALAGATQLDRRSGAIERAIAAVQGGLVTNSTLFSNDGAGIDIDVTNAIQIVFYSTRADAEAGTNAILASETTRFAEAGFVHVFVDTRDANYAFTPVVGAINGSLNGSAVAGLGSALCRIPPLMICNPDENTSSSTPPDMDIAGRIGHGLLVKPGGGGGWEPGNYGYLDVSLANGAVGVRQAIGWDGPPGACLAQNGVDTLQVDTEPGNIANASFAAMNTRFDIIDNPACESGGTCSPAMNSRKDLMRAANATSTSCSAKNGDWVEGANRYLPNDATVDYAGTPDAMGHPRDRCHAVEDGDPGHCYDPDPGVGNFGDGVWDRDAYFRTHYVRSDGSRWTDAEWRANILANGYPGGVQVAAAGLDNVTRYEVYKWEEEYAGDLIDGVRILEDNPAGAMGATLVEHGQPVCGTGISRPDRRRITVAVINCELHGVKGKSRDLPVRRWIDVFLVQPAMNRDRTRQDEIYVEIIGETDLSRSGAPFGPTIRRDVPYLVR